MSAEQITALTGAFNPAQLVDTFVKFGPFIMVIAGTILAVSLAKWGVRTLRRKLSGGVA
jgi:hypothetical protein